MKINFILPAIGTSGGIDVIYKYVELLSNRGHDVCVYKELQASNMYRYKLGCINYLHQIYCTIKAILNKKQWQHKEDRFVMKLNDQSVRDADVIVATAWTTAYKISALSKNKGRKYYFIQDYEIWDNSEFVKRTYKLALQKVVISTWINNCLKKDLGIGPFPIVHNGLDLEVFHPVNIRKDKGNINFIMLNHRLQKKGVENGLKVYERISREYKNCRLRMFGICDSKNLPNYVEYYKKPSREKLVELYSMSDIFIFPSLEEGWGLTPLEAMACGSVVVGTNTGFVLDIGKHRENMMISEPGDIDGMVHNIEALLENSALVKKIRENAYTTVSRLNWESSRDKLIEYLSKDEEVV